MEGTIERYDETTNLALIWVNDKNTTMMNMLQPAKVREDPTKGLLFRAILRTDNKGWMNYDVYDKPLSESYIGFNPSPSNEYGVVPIEVCEIKNKKNE